MGFLVVADAPAAFRTWLSRQERPATSSNAIFEQQCSSCHAVRGTPAQSDVGPDLTHIASRTTLAGASIPNTPAELARWITDSQSIKPGNQMPDIPMPAAKLHALVAYLETLK
jgi:cytochrome c oxidase subunit 2